MKLCVTRKDHYIGRGGRGGTLHKRLLFSPKCPYIIQPRQFINKYCNWANSWIPLGTLGFFSCAAIKCGGDVPNSTFFFLSHARRSDSTLSFAPSSSKELFARLTIKTWQKLETERERPLEPRVFINQKHQIQQNKGENPKAARRQTSWSFTCETKALKCRT